MLCEEKFGLFERSFLSLDLEPGRSQYVDSPCAPCCSVNSDILLRFRCCLFEIKGVLPNKLRLGFRLSLVIVLPPEITNLLCRAR